MPKLPSSIALLEYLSGVLAILIAFGTPFSGYFLGMATFKFALFSGILAGGAAAKNWFDDVLTRRKQALENREDA